MKRILFFIWLLLLAGVATAQFPNGTDTLRNYNNRFIDNNAQKAFTNLRLHNLLAGMINHMDTIALGGSVNLGMDTAFMFNDSLFTYRKGGVFRQFVIRGTGGLAGSGEIYRIPFNDGLGKFINDSNFKFDKSIAADATRLIVGPTAVSSGGYAKINATSDNMNALALTSYGTGLNTIVARRAHGTIGSPTALVNDDDLFNISGRGYAASDFTGSRAAIFARTAQDWTGTANGTRLYFSTTANDSTTMRDRLMIDHDGAVGINNSSPSFGLHVNRSTGILKDSVPIVSAVTSQSVMLIDTATGQVKRISSSNLNVTASNGLTKTGNDIALGGTINSLTTINSAGTGTERITISGNSSSVWAPLVINDAGTGGALFLLSTNAAGQTLYSENTAVGGQGIQSISNNGIAIQTHDAGGGIALQATTLLGGIPIVTQLSTAGNSIATGVRLGRVNASGVGGTNLGTDITWQHENTSSVEVDAAKITSYWTDATAGSENSYLDFWTNNNGTFDNKLSIKDNGQLQATKYITAGSFTVNDTTTYKPMAVDATGNLFRMDGWKGSGAGGSADSSIFSTDYQRDTALANIRSYYPKYYNVTNFGAIGDGKEKYDASVTSGSPTLTSATAAFTAQDAGKAIRIYGAGPSGQDLVTTILSYTNSTTVTLATNASSTITGDTIVYGTDNVPAIQAAIDAANDGGGDAVVIIPPPGSGKFYVLAGPLNHTYDGGDCNCQIVIPVSDLGAGGDTSFNTRKHIVIDGLMPPNHSPSALFGDTLTPKFNTTLVSIIHGSGTRAAVFGSKAPSTVFADGINYNMFTVKNIALFVERNRAGGGPDIGGFNFYHMSSTPMENVVVGINGPFHDMAEPLNEVAGIIAGQLSSEIYTSMKNVSVYGFKYGLAVTEAVTLDHVIAHGCVNGIVLTSGNYATVGGYVGAHWCKNSLLIPNTTVLGISPGLVRFDIQFFEIEIFSGPSGLGAPAWMAYSYIVNDVGNRGRGKLTYLIGQAECCINNALFNKNGGDSVFCLQVGSKVDPNPHTYAGLTTYAGWQNGGAENYFYNWSPISDASIMRLAPVATNTSQGLYMSPTGTGGSGLPQTWINMFNTEFWSGVNSTNSNWEGMQIATSGTSYYMKSIQSGSGSLRPISIQAGSTANQIRLNTNGTTEVNGGALLINRSSAIASELLSVNGKINANADSVGTATGGFVFRDAATGEFKLTNVQAALKGTINWTPGVVAAGSSTSTTITVTGAVVGDPVTVSKKSGLSNGEIYDGSVTAPNTVTLRVHNVSTGSANYSSAADYNVIVLKY
jgi:hypothetical protein